MPPDSGDTREQAGGRSSSCFRAELSRTCTGKKAEQSFTFLAADDVPCLQKSTLDGCPLRHGDCCGLYVTVSTLSCPPLNCLSRIVVCGFFFYKVTNDIPGFQNRLGLFLFILSLFGFSTLTSLGVFANERMLFMRERYVCINGQPVP